MKETEAVFAPLRKRIETAVEALESLLVGSVGGGDVGRVLILGQEASEEGRGDGSGPGEMERAREAVGKMRGNGTA